MKHLNEEELVEQYYASQDAEIANEPGPRGTELERHLQECAECAAAYDEIVRVLDAAQGPALPARPADYGQQVWSSIRSSLPVYEPKPRRSWFHLPVWAYAMAGVLLLAGAFYAGKLWERTNTHPQLAGNQQQGRERVVLFVLDGHLDRSERLLVQLSHAGDEAGAEVQPVALPLQNEARQLLADNRLYRQSVAAGKDPLLAGALDHLERVLVEIANSPDGISSEDVERIGKELNTDGLLFEIRVLRAHVADQQTKQRTGAASFGKGRTVL